MSGRNTAKEGKRTGRPSRDPNDDRKQNERPSRDRNDERNHDGRPARDQNDRRRSTSRRSTSASKRDDGPPSKIFKSSLPQQPQSKPQLQPKLQPKPQPKRQQIEHQQRRRTNSEARGSVTLDEYTLSKIFDYMMGR